MLTLLFFLTFAQAQTTTKLPSSLSEKACDPTIEKLLPRKEIEKIFGRKMFPFVQKKMTAKMKEIGCTEEPRGVSGMKRCYYFLGCENCWEEKECSRDVIELAVVPRENMTLAPIPMLKIENDVQEMKFYCNEQKETCRYLDGIGEAGRTNPERTTATVLCGKHHVTVTVPKEAWGKPGDGPLAKNGLIKTPEDTAVRIITLLNKACPPPKPVTSAAPTSAPTSEQNH